MDFQQLSAYLEKLPARFSVKSYDLKVMQNHRCLFRQSGGFRDHACREAVRADDLYDVYSCTKPLTIAAVLKLCEEGRLGLDDELSHYLPEFKQMQVAADFHFDRRTGRWPDASAPLRAAQRPITLRQLMSMTAGLSYDSTHPLIRAAVRQGGTKTSTRDIVRAIAGMPLIFDPGDDWLYSLAHDVLGAVIEVVSGLAFGDYLQKYFFTPLGMQNSCMKQCDIPPERLSAYYSYDASSGRVIPTDSVNSHRFSEVYESGGAGLCCTVDDYSLFADAIACGGMAGNGRRILRPETVELFKEDQLNDRQRKSYQASEDPAYSYGLGVRTLKDPTKSKSPLGEFGWCGAAGAYVLFDTANQLSIFYAHHILYDRPFQDQAHTAIRDLVYESLER